jgi:hypothetical protein
MPLPLLRIRASRFYRALRDVAKEKDTLEAVPEAFQRL